MLVAALFMCMLSALGSAHVYERCELARELASLGIEKEHLATWVCIAYHESRFDTAARNHGSGDHGLLQISELYWCGPGKACGVPCTAFRDEDISDDVECAQKIYKEHTRLQGDGFLAWVVYPLHCKNNPKKYLAECEAFFKNGTENVDAKARSLKSRSRHIASPRTFQTDYRDTNRPKPSYLAINSIFESYSKAIENTNEVEDWLDFKIDNVDSLKLPVTNTNDIRFPVPQTISTSYKSTISTPNFNHDNSPYLAIRTLFEGDYYKQFLNNNKQRTDWLDYKVEDIDSLKLPVFSKNGEIQFVAPPKTSASHKAPSVAKSLNIDSYKSTVPFLSIKAIFETDSYKQFQNNNKQRTDWLEYKINNIDSLKLPGSMKDGKIQFVIPPTNYIKPKSTFVATPRSRVTTTTIKPTTTTIEPELIGIKPPMPKKIESNQFRRKKVLSNVNLSYSDLAKTDVSKAKNVVPLTAESSSQEATHTTKRPLINSPNVAKNINFPVTSSPFSAKPIFNYQSVQPTYSTPSSNTSLSGPSEINSFRYNETPLFQENVKDVSTVRTSSTLKPVPEQTTAKPSDKVFDIPSQTYTSPFNQFNYFNSYNSKIPVIGTTNFTETAKGSTTSPLSNNQRPIITSSLQNISHFNGVEQKPTNTIKETITTKSPLNAFATIKTSNYNLPFSNKISNNYIYNQSIKQQANSASQNSGNSSKFANSTNTFFATAKASKEYSNVAQTTKTWSRVTTSKPQTASTSRKFSPFTYKLVATTPYPAVATSVTQVNKSSTSKPYTNVPPTASTSWKFSTSTYRPIVSTPSPVVLTSVVQANKSSTSKSLTSLLTTPSTSWKFSPFTYKPIPSTPSPVALTTVPLVNKTSTWIQNSTKFPTSTPKAPETSSKSTLSIFDLYLRPQKFTLPPFQFPSFNTSFHKVQIFSGGTTALPPSYRALVKT